jgi:glyoxylase-like metal-dependent hydrolase (beta-lactamase superfamily II)
MQDRGNSLRRCRAGLLLGLLAAIAASAQPQRQVTKLAEGVHEIQHQAEPYESGNTTVIIGERQVFVVDTCYLPSSAREDIAQIRQWTKKPVTFVLSTHFHNDHNLGNRAYMDAFPGLTIIAHVETKREMDMFGPGSERRLEQETASLRKMLDTGHARGGRPLTPEEKAEVKTVLTQRLPGIEELEGVEFQSATLTFDHDFTIDLGNRAVEVKFLGRGKTGGDAVAHLPRERIVAAGDLVVQPIPYVYDGYPSGWIQIAGDDEGLGAAFDDATWSRRCSKRPACADGRAPTPGQ